MLQPPSAPPFPSSPAGSNFTPRKEFIETPPRQSSTFALLAFSSNNAIRLSNFPQPLVTALKSLLNTVIGLRSFRENAEHKLAEIILTGKPWSRSKSLSTEIILVQVFNVLLAHDYNIVSQIDYGREHNDRISLAFSTPIPTLGEPQPAQPRLVTFALSFPSPTVLRVVCPPLHATPAILASVRGAWPRGVNNEKKLGEGCYEFKLKGYSWFSEDTFSDDALAHTLTILTALDRHGCKLLTSLALTASRPRNKDLWIFSAPGPGVTASPTAGADMMMDSPVRLGSPLKPSTYEPIVDHSAEGSGDSEGTRAPEASNSRGATVDGGLPGHVTRDDHARSPSDQAAVTARNKNPSKPVASDEFVYPAYSHDIIPGPPPEVVYTSAPPRGQTDIIHVSELPQHFAAHDSPPKSQSPFGISPALTSLPEATELHPSDEDVPPHEVQAKVDASPSNASTPTVHAPDLPTPPLLPPAAFRTPLDEPRDSGFSVGSGRSFDVPITWIPSSQPPPSAFLNVDARTDADRSSITTGPLPPGGWSSTPAVEADDSIAREGASQAAGDERRSSTHTTVMPERQDSLAPHSPEIVHPPHICEDVAGRGSLRKSEAGSLGVFPSPAREDAPPVPQANEDASTVTPEATEKPKEGWVKVSVAQGESPATASPTSSQTAPVQDHAAQAPTTHVPVTTAQLIAAADATDTTFSSPVASTPPITGETKPSSTLGRLFSRSHRKDGSVQKTRSVEREADIEKEKGRRFRRKGGVLPTLRSGKRESID